MYHIRSIQHDSHNKQTVISLCETSKKVVKQRIFLKKILTIHELENIGHSDQQKDLTAI